MAAITGFPTVFPYKLLIDWGSFVAGSVQEAVSVTASTGSGPYTLTVVRGVDGTGGQTHLNAAQVVHGVTGQEYVNMPTAGQAYAIALNRAGP